MKSRLRKNIKSAIEMREYVIPTTPLYNPLGTGESDSEFKDTDSKSYQQMFNFKRKSVPVNTIIGKDLVVHGNIENIVNTDLILIEGIINGNIKINSALKIAKGGVVNGNIKACTVIIYGIVEGNIIAEDIIHIGGTGKVNGNITASSFVIEDGQLNGKVTTIRDTE